MASQPPVRPIFITGTDTGVGKTLVTGLLLEQLRQSGCRAWAIKPFCSGGRLDVDLLHALQDGELTASQINPFFFPEPLAPLVATRRHGRVIPLHDVLKHIRALLRAIGRKPTTAQRPSRSSQSPCLLIEGAGGALTPLGEGFTILDLIAELDGEAIVVSRNELGTINHTLLTVHALQQAGTEVLRVVLMDPRRPDPSSASNGRVLAELLAPVPVLGLDFLGKNALGVAAVKKNQKKVQETLARILGLDTVSAPVLFFVGPEKAGTRKNRRKRR